MRPAAAFVVALLLVGCRGADSEASPRFLESGSLTEVVDQLAEAELFARAMAAARPGVVETGPMTALVPLDSAVSAWLVAQGRTIEDLLEVQADVDRFVGDHLIDGIFDSTALLNSEGTRVASRAGDELVVGRDDNLVTLRVGDAGPVSRVVAIDLDARGSIVHVIDGVLVPGTAAP